MEQQESKFYPVRMRRRFTQTALRAKDCVMMTGDSERTAAADVGIAISDGAEIAREIADITVGADDLYQFKKHEQLTKLA